MELELSLLLLVAPLFVLSALLFFTFRRSQPSTADPRSIPCSSMSALLRNRHRILDWISELLAASPTGTVSTFMGVVTGDPSNVEHMLKTHFGNYPKGLRFTSILADFLGVGIFNSDGDNWRLQRKTASLEFNTKTIRTFILGNLCLAVADRLLVRLSRAAAAGEVLDLQELLDRLAFDNVCKVVFDVDPARLLGEDDDAVREFAHAFEDSMGLIVRRFQHPFPFTWKLMRLLCIGSEQIFKEKIATVHRFASEVSVCTISNAKLMFEKDPLKIPRRKIFSELNVIRAKKEVGPAAMSDDLLSRFITDANYSNEFLRDIVISFVLAGRDSASSTLTWFFWLISTRPEVRDRILNEIRRVRSGRRSPAEGDALFTLEELRDMDYLHAVLTETLRLYPPVPLQSRECAADDVWPDGTRVARGRTVMYSSYAMGRMEAIWGADCGDFRPERWLDKDGVFRAVSPFQFPVFHAGPRMCLGRDMAYIQMKVVAASVLERFEVQVVDDGREREKELIMFLKMKGGLLVRVLERAATPTEKVHA